MKKLNLAQGHSEIPMRIELTILPHWTASPSKYQSCSPISNVTLFFWVFVVLFLFLFFLLFFFFFVSFVYSPSGLLCQYPVPSLFLLQLFVFACHVFADSHRQLPASWRFRFSIEKRSTCKQEKPRRKRHSAFICQRLSLTRGGGQYGEQGEEQTKPLARESQKQNRRPKTKLHKRPAWRAPSK